MAVGYVAYLVGHTLDRRFGSGDDPWFLAVYVGLLAMLIVVLVAAGLSALLYHNWQWAQTIAQ